MKKGVFILSLLTIVIMSLSVHSIAPQRGQYVSPYPSQWHKVALAQKDNLPQDAIGELRKIYDKALSADNMFETLRAYQILAQIETSIDYNYRFAAIDTLLMNRGLYRSATDKALYDLTLAQMMSKTAPRGGREDDNITEQAYQQWSTATAQKSIVNLVEDIVSMDTLKNVEAYIYNDFIFGDDNTPKVAPKNLYQALLVASLNITSRYNDTLTTELYDKLLLEYRTDIPQYISTYTLYMEYLNRMKGNNNTYADSLSRLIERYPNEMSIVGAIASRAEMQTPSVWQSESEDSFLALDSLCKATIKRFPNSPYINKIENISKRLHSKSISVEFPAQLYPAKSAQVDITTKNVPKIELKVWLLPKYSAITALNTPRDALQKVVKKLTPIVSKTITSKNVLFLPQESQESITLREEGIYVVGVQSDDTLYYNYNTLSVSRVGALFSNIGGTSIYAADFDSGKPFKDVVINTVKEEITNNYRAIYTIGSSKKISLDGFTPLKIEINNRARPRVSVYYGKDKFSPATLLYNSVFEPITKQKSYYIVTDRSRYMPGDTVRYKGVAMVRDAMGVSVDPGSKIAIKFNGTSANILAEDTLMSDKWGSFNGFFVTEQRALNGLYSIQCANSSTYFNVESYKAPTLAVELMNPTQGYAIGDTVKIKGRVSAYAGYPLSGLKVYYTVIKRPSYWLRSTSTQDIVASGEVLCPHDGSFDISFPTAKEYQSGIYTYRYGTQYSITVKATDIKGESRQATKNITLSDKKYTNIINATSKGTIDIDVPMELNVLAMTHYGNIDSLRGQCTVTDAKGKSIVARFVTGSPSSIDVRSLSSGQCEIALNIDHQVECSKAILFSAKQKSLPIDTLIFFAPTNTLATTDKAITFTLGTNQSELYAQVSLIYRDSVIYSKAHTFLSGMQNYSLPYLKKYPAQMVLSIDFIRSGKVYNIQENVSRSDTEQNLTLKLITERKAAPASKERVGIEVLNAKGEAVEADVTMSIFDKSTQQYRKNVYAKIDNAPLHAGWVNFTNGSGFFNKVINPQYVNKDETITSISYGMRSAETNFADDSEQASSRAIVGYGMTGAAKSDAEPTVIVVDNVRRNFRRTAAFFPNIRTDANGLAQVSFTMPEAMTTYSVEAMAYDLALNSAVASAEIVVNKDVMIVPNTPLFIRKDDQITIKATVVNSSAQRLSGTASIQLSDTNNPSKVILGRGTQSKSVTMAPYSSQVVEWSLSKVPNVPVLSIRTTIETPTQRDSEERMVAIISGDEPIIDSKTYVIVNDSISINLKEMLKGGVKDEMMMVSSKSTPIMLLNTMPFSSKVESENALSMIESWYLSTVGRRMVRRFSTYINSLTKSTEKTDYPLKNYSEITDIVAEQTPWVRQSLLPQERLTAMNEYLNRKQTIDRNWEMFLNIGKLQGDDGGISWFSGMPPSSVLTAMMLDRYASLLEAKYYTSTNYKTVHRAIAFLDRTITAQYRSDSIAQAKNTKEDMPLSTNLLNNLYIRSRFDDSLRREPQDSIAFDKLVSRAKKSWRKGSIMDMTLTALTLKNRGENTEPIITSIGQYAVKGDNGVVFYPNAVAYRAMLSSEIRAHALLMKLLLGNEQTAQLGDGVARWLMLQRNNQQWENNSATAEVVQQLWQHYLVYNRDTTSRVYSRYPIDKSIAAPGYANFVSMPLLKSTNGSIIVANKGNTPRFVDVIYRYSAPLGSIAPKSNGISVTRKLMRERVVDGKIVLENIDPTTILNIGDIVVVRNIMDADNDYSMVILQSKRSGALLPVNDTSGYAQGSYREVKPSQTNYFFDTLPRGVSSVDERLYVSYQGTFSDAIATVISLSNPVNSGNSSSSDLRVK